MSITNLATLIERLPPGRARRRYEQLLALSREALVVAAVGGPVWLVLDSADILVSRGIPRWRVWTLREAQDFLGACGVKVQTLEEAALTFGSVPPQSTEDHL